MGHNVGANKALLVFDEGSLLAGATVRVSLTVKLRQFFTLQQALPAFANVAGLTAEDAERGDEMCDEFVESGALLSWNLEREDEGDVLQPIPADREGFMSLLLAHRIAIISAWVSAISEATGPSPKPSTASASIEPVSLSGARSEAGFEEMAAV